MTIPQDIINHCNAYPGCKGCPLGTCTAPVTQYPSEQWEAWLQQRIDLIREVKNA